MWVLVDGWVVLVLCVCMRIRCLISSRFGQGWRVAFSENVLLTEEGRCKLADFGLARRLHVAAQPLTAPPADPSARSFRLIHATQPCGVHPVPGGEAAGRFVSASVCSLKVSPNDQKTYLLFQINGGGVIFSENWYKFNRFDYFP